MPNHARRVVVGMSGGVDSSVTAALLRDAGYDVIGMTMQIWHKSATGSDDTTSAGCCTIDAVDDARRVARALGIPYYVPNFRQSFSIVVDDFAREYAAGRTPNPCVRCNQFVRFDGLMRKADELEAEHVATGHYARVEFDRSRNEFVLKKGRDHAKDQSYVLHTLKQRHLSRLLMPLGDFTKAETRAAAHGYDLAVAGKPDSQELCFVAGDYRQFLRETAGLDSRPGPIVDRSGNVVGMHDGIHRFTIGQRKGLGLASPEPSFVIELRLSENTVVIGRREDAGHSRLECEDLHFTGALDADRFDAHVRVRSHGAEVAAAVRLKGERAEVCFEQPIWGASPGQLAVFYDDDRVIGGGAIAAVGS